MHRHHKTSLRAHISSATSAFFEESSENLQLISLCFRRSLPLEIPVDQQSPPFRLSEKHLAERKRKKRKRTLNTLFLAVFTRHITDSSCAGQREPKETAAHVKKKLNKYSENKKKKP